MVVSCVPTMCRGAPCMTLAELYDTLAPAFPLRAQQNMKTAIRHLAAALHCADPQHCSLAQCNQPLPALYRLLETHLRTHGHPRTGHTSHLIRNTKNNISRLFRCAEAQQLFSLPPHTLPPSPDTLPPRYDSYRRPPRLATPVSNPNGTFLVYA